MDKKEAGKDKASQGASKSHGMINCIEKLMDSLLHATRCRLSGDSLYSDQRNVSSCQGCMMICAGQCHRCPICTNLALLYKTHAEMCTADNCLVPGCAQMKKT